MRLAQVDMNLYQVLREPVSGSPEIVALAVRPADGKLWSAVDSGNAPLTNLSFDRPSDVLEWIKNKAPVSVRMIQQYVADHYGLTLEDIKSNRRAARLVLPRQLAMWLSAELLPHMSLPTIGRAFDRDHTTVMHAHRAMRKRLDDPLFLAEVNRIRARVTGWLTSPPRTIEETALKVAGDVVDAVRVALMELAKQNPAGFLTQISAIAAVQPPTALRIAHSRSR